MATVFGIGQPGARREAAVSNVTGARHWPNDLDPRTICFTVDIEWAHPMVVDDLAGLFDAHGVLATLFVTHVGVRAGRHERGLHPNFRRNGDTLRLLRERHGASFTDLDDDAINRHVIETSKAFAPEAKGLRTHSLHHDSTLLPLYRDFGLEYDCTYQLPLVAGLRPVWKQHDVLSIPTYYADHFDIMTQATGFDPGRLCLETEGIKVLDFHPNVVFLNAPSNALYAGTRSIYHDPEKLLASRHDGRGIRTLLIELLETIAVKRLPTATAGQINRAWRNLPRQWG